MSVDFEREKSSADIASVMESDDVVVVVEHGEDGSVMRSEVHAASGVKIEAERTESHDEPADTQAAADRGDVMPSDDHAAVGAKVETERTESHGEAADGRAPPDAEAHATSGVKVEVERTESHDEPAASQVPQDGGDGGATQSELEEAPTDVVQPTAERETTDVDMPDAEPAKEAAPDQPPAPQSDTPDKGAAAAAGQDDARRPSGDAMETDVDVTGLSAQAMASKYADCRMLAQGLGGSLSGSLSPLVV
jgi:hypothetical protein